MSKKSWRIFHGLPGDAMKRGIVGGAKTCAERAAAKNLANRLKSPSKNAGDVALGARSQKVARIGAQSRVGGSPGSQGAAIPLIIALSDEYTLMLARRLAMSQANTSLS